MSRKVLFLCAEFGKPTNACSVCISNVAREFFKHQYEVYIISAVSIKHKNQFESCYSVIELKRDLLMRLWNKKLTSNSLLYKFLYKFVYLFRLPFNLLLYPSHNLRLTSLVIKNAKKLIAEYKIDTIVGVYTPFEMIYSSCRLKQYYGEQINVVNYHLDPLLIPDNSLLWINNFKIRRGQKFFGYECQTIDKIICPPSTKQIVHDKKAVFADFPLYLENEGISLVPASFSYQNDCINVAYVGTLDIVNRDISYLIELLNTVINEYSCKLILHIWGLLSDNDTKLILTKYDFVKYHGFIDSSLVNDLLRKADFVVNVSNMKSYNAVPSKIFQLFSSHKPIINLLRHPLDCTIPYFKLYTFYINIKDFNKSDSDSEKLATFIRENYKKEISIDEHFFEQSRPSYIYNLITS